MARMYSRNKGKSGSTKPSDTKKKSWVKYGTKEVESLILKLNEDGYKPSKIGTILRDSYGIPDVKVITGKKITQILEKNKIVPLLPEDVSSLIKREIVILEHIEKNKQDQTARRGLILTDSKIKALVRYYKKTGRLAKDWKYDKKKAKLLVN
ncbi:30S ribosomal protein S15 [archaeon]|jgi:small subunit ribosomal protein S15|nr:30S ribosomal protein S15 [archaeon]